MAKNRVRELLLKAAEAMEDGRDPFSGDFLSANNVTLDECYTLSEQLATITRGWLAMPEDEQIEHVAIGALHKEAPEIIPSFRNQLKMKRTLKELKKL